jgi:hypothetical protein
MIALLLIATLQTQDLWDKCVAKVNSVQTLTCEQRSTTGAITNISKFQIDRQGARLQITVGGRGASIDPQATIYIWHNGEGIKGDITASSAGFHPTRYTPAPNVYNEIWRGRIDGPLRCKTTTFLGSSAYEFRKFDADSDSDSLTHNEAVTEYFFDPATLLPLGVIYEDKATKFRMQIQITKTVVNADPKAWKITKESATRMAQNWLATGH